MSDHNGDDKLIRCTIPSVKDIAYGRIAAVNLDNFKGVVGRAVLGLQINSYEIVGDIVIADINIVLKPQEY